MDTLDYWRLCDELSIEQAARLIVGTIPGELEAMQAVGSELTPRSSARFHTEMGAVRTAISNAMRGNRLAGQLRYEVAQTWDSISECMVDVESPAIDLERSTVLVSDLKMWLASRGLRSGFFFPNAVEVAEYLDPTHSRYAPKLAAAVKGWLAVDDPKGKHPKQALLKWLREHASEFGLTDEEGKPNEQGIEECAKVANWQMSGGAPRTPAA